MERNASLAEAKQIFGSDLIGPEELHKISYRFPVSIPVLPPPIPFSVDFLQLKKGAYILVLGLSKFDNKPMNIRNLRNFFGLKPGKQEPCFYNQDWYLKETFIDEPLEESWFLLKKEVFDDTRAKMPGTLECTLNLPRAVMCTYAFFTFFLCCNEILWKYDFIWCSDSDHNGDRIYVGKYIDIAGMNKNGFSIHRYLRLTQNYAAIDIIH
jgi:hypothetical protein